MPMLSAATVACGVLLAGRPLAVGVDGPRGLGGARMLSAAPAPDGWQETAARKPAVSAEELAELEATVEKERAAWNAKTFAEDFSTSDFNTGRAAPSPVASCGEAQAADSAAETLHRFVNVGCEAVVPPDSMVIGEGGAKELEAIVTGEVMRRNARDYAEDWSRAFEDQPATPRRCEWEQLSAALTAAFARTAEVSPQHPAADCLKQADAAALMEACARAPGAGGVGACALPSWFPPHLQYAKRTELTHRRAWPSESPQALERHCTWEEGRYTRNSVLKGDGFEAMVSSQSAKRVC